MQSKNDEKNQKEEDENAVVQPVQSQIDLLNKPKKKKKQESLLKTDKRALGSKPY